MREGGTGGWAQSGLSEFEILEVAILNGDLGPNLDNANGWAKGNRVKITKVEKEFTSLFFMHLWFLDYY